MSFFFNTDLKITMFDTLLCVLTLMYFYCCCVYEWNYNLCNRLNHAIDTYFLIRLLEIPGCNSVSRQVSSGLAWHQQNISGPCMPLLHPNINRQHLPHSLETVDLWQPTCTTENLTGVQVYWL